MDLVYLAVWVFKATVWLTSSIDLMDALGYNLG